MNSKTKILFPGAILTLCFTGIPAHAHTVNFSGKIISETCQIADNSGNVDVNFGSVNMDTLKSHEQTTAQTPFQIHLTGCPTAQNVSIGLEGTPDTHAHGKADGVLAMNAGEGVAQGVGIEVYSSDDGSTQGTQLTFDHQVKTTAKQADGNGDITFGFLADLKSDSDVDVTAGNINATASIDINYE